jgi:hypothetical protein
VIDAHVAQGLRAWGVHGAQLSYISVTHGGLLATGAVSRHQSVGSLPLLATSSTLCMCFCNTCAVSVHQLLAALWAAPAAHKTVCSVNRPCVQSHPTGPIHRRRLRRGCCPCAPFCLCRQYCRAAASVALLCLLAFPAPLTAAAGGATGVW